MRRDTESGSFCFAAAEMRPRSQRTVEQIYMYLIVIFGAIAWVFGYFAQDFKVTFGGWLVGLVIA